MLEGNKIGNLVKVEVTVIIKRVAIRIEGETITIKEEDTKTTEATMLTINNRSNRTKRRDHLK